MNFFQIISEIEKVDPEVYDRLDSRRSIFKNMAGLGQKLSAAALPLAVGAIFNKAYAQTPVGAGVTDVLNFALKLEYLESYFYNLRTGRNEPDEHSECRCSCPDCNRRIEPRKLSAHDHYGTGWYAYPRTGYCWRI